MAQSCSIYIDVPKITAGDDVTLNLLEIFITQISPLFFTTKIFLKSGKFNIIIIEDYITLFIIIFNTINYYFIIVSLLLIRFYCRYYYIETTVDLFLSSVNERFLICLIILLPPIIDNFNTTLLIMIE